MKLLLLGQPASGLGALADQIRQTIGQDVDPTQAPSVHAFEVPWPLMGRDSLQAQDLVLLIDSPPPSGTNAETDWRGLLIQAGMAFQVIHACASERLEQQIFWALGDHLRRLTGRSPWPLREEIVARWQGLCESCSDPDCEHRLFQRLVKPTQA